MSNITKKALENSLKKLLETKRIDRITIKELTDDCEISRGAFYYHFHDIYELVEWIFIHDYIEPFNQAITSASWDESLTFILNKMYRDRDFLYSIYHFINFKQLQNYLYALFSGYLYKMIETKSEGRLLDEENKHSLISFYKYSIVGAIFDWLDNGMKVLPVPENVVGKVKLFISGIDYWIDKFGF